MVRVLLVTCAAIWVSPSGTMVEGDEVLRPRVVLLADDAWQIDDRTALRLLAGLLPDAEVVLLATPAMASPMARRTRSPMPPSWLDASSAGSA